MRTAKTNDSMMTLKCCLALLATLSLAACVHAPVAAPSASLAVAADVQRTPSATEPVLPAVVTAVPGSVEAVPVVDATPQAGATGAAATSATAAPNLSDPAPAAIDPLRPDVRIDPHDREAKVDLWSRTRRGFAMPDLDSELVRKWEQYYASKPDYLQRMLERGGRYLFHIVEELSRRDMPTELALLPFIESAFNPQAMSSAKASGMWQFVPGTGRDFDLKQNVFRDDRRDVLASTRAAMDYLKSLHGMFNDWHLALAAYNWGQGSVRRALARNAQAGLGSGYEQLGMPAETRNYVPKLQAVKNLISRPHDFGLVLPALQNHPYFLAVPIARDIDVDIAARLSGIGLDEFKQLNPQMNKPVILAAGTPRVLLPYDAANRFVQALTTHKGVLSTWTAWTAPKTVRVADVAKQLGMSEPVLREVNHIPPHMVIKAGSTLLVHRHGSHQADVAEHLADHATLALAREGPALRKLSFKAGKHGATVAAVARQHKVSATQVAQWNGVSVNGSFKAGQAIVIMAAQRRTQLAGSGKAKGSRKATRVAATVNPRTAHKPGAAARRS
jgi:membrane-bound lytic murein transglycosylase D